MSGTRQSAKRQLSKKRRLLAILEEQVAGYTELEAPVSKLAERDQLREEVARLEALLASGELPEADEAELSVWEGVGARIEPEEVSLVHPSSPKALLKKTGRTLMAIQLKVRRPAQPRKLMRIAFGVLIALALLGTGFLIYMRFGAPPTPIPWPTPLKVETPQALKLGFANLWNRDPGVQRRLGEAIDEEQKVFYLEQHFSDNGIMLQFIDPPSPFIGPLSPFIYVLYGDGQWEFYEGKPAVESGGTPTGEVAVAPSFRLIYERRKSVRERLGSPQEYPREVQGTFQNFKHGQMIWTGNSDRHIYALSVVGDQPDRWFRYADTWVAPGDIVFTSNGTGSWQIHTATSRGSDEVPLTVEPADVDNFEPVWVPPDGKSIAFVSTESGLAKIWLIDRNGSNRRQLTVGPGNDGHPSVVWDGRLLAFHSDREDGVFQIYLINLDGTNEHRLTYDSFDNRNPDWAPDGQSLVFDSKREDRRGIYSVDVETRRVELILNPKDGETYQQPAWSPDGKRLAFVSCAAGQYVIYVTKADGSELTKIEGSTSFKKVDAPSWSSDGQRLAFTAYEGGKASVVIVDVSNGSIVTRISGLGDYRDPDW